VVEKAGLRIEDSGWVALARWLLHSDQEIKMDWLQLISAVGIRALLTKVLDIVWLQRTMREAEKKKQA
jgi:hypothetical protein